MHGQAVSGLIPPADGTNQISDCRICSIVHAHEPLNSIIMSAYTV